MSDQRAAPLSVSRVMAIAAIVLLAAGLLWRCGSLAGFYRASRAGQAPAVARAIQTSLAAAAIAPDAEPYRRFVRELRRRLPKATTERLEVHAWDPDAPVYVTAGADGQPGQAGFDDDQDGIVDNPSELGAVFSDDVTLAPTSTGYAAAETAPHARVISRGAYLPLEPGQPLPAETRLRAVVHATAAGGQRIVWPVEPPP